MKTERAGLLVPLALLTVGGIFGSAFILKHELVKEISALEVAASRLALGAAFVFVLLMVRRSAVRPAPRLLAGIALLAVIDSVIPFTLVTWSQTRIDAGLASVIVSTMPLFTVAFAALVGERVTLTRAGGVALGFAGVLLVTDGGLLHGASGDGLGMLALVAAAACYGAGAVYGRRLMRSIDPLNLIGLKLALGALIIVPVILASGEGGGYAAMSAGAWASVLLLGIVATGVAWSLYFWVLSAAGSVKASLVTYINPLVAVFLGWLLLGEEISANMALGGTLILAGVACALYGHRLRLPGIRSEEARVGPPGTAVTRPQSQPFR